MSTKWESDYPGLDEWIGMFMKNRGNIVFTILIFLVLSLGSKAYFQAEADEEAIVLRLGVPTGVIYGPGLHFNIPLVDKVYKANVKKVHQLEFGFRTTRAAINSQFDEGSYQDESLMLTGDLALVQVQWTVFCRIADLEAYLFNVRDVESTIRDLSEASLRVLVGYRSSDEVMTLHRGEIAQRAKGLVQVSLDLCDSGIFVEKVALRQVEPPLAAQEAFNRVNEARARKQQMIEQAERGRVEAVEKARGERNALVAQARGQKEQMVQAARGESLRFLRFLQEYRKAPGITRQWLYLDAMETVLAAADRKVILEGGMGGENGVLKVLPLGELSSGLSGGNGGGKRK